jgi:hypothetical protein
VGAGAVCRIAGSESMLVGESSKLEGGVGMGRCRWDELGFLGGAISVSSSGSDERKGGEG